MLIAKISRTTQPPRVPPAIAPLLGLNPSDSDAWGPEMEVVLVEAGCRSQSRSASSFKGDIEEHRPVLVKCVTCRSAATSGSRFSK